jgi:hypothetical protein
MSPMPPLTDKSTALCRPAASAGHGHDRQQRRFEKEHRCRCLAPTCRLPGATTGPS